MGRERVTIRVVDPEGRPVPGAEVAVQGPALPAEPARATADAKGVCVIEVTRPKDRWRYGWAVAFSSSYGIAGTPLREPEVTIELPPPGEVRGRVVDEEGRPVAGARVRVTRVMGRERGTNIPSLEPLAEHVSAMTDTDGGFVIGNMPAQGRAFVTLDDPRFATDATLSRLGAEAPLAEPLLAVPGGTIEGRVVFEDGRPAPGVAMTFGAQPARGPTRRRFYFGGGPVVSGAEGRYRIPQLPAGIYDIVMDDRSSEWVAVAVQGLAVHTGETVTAPDMVLIAGGFIAGTVTDADTGRPVADITVGCYGPHRPRTQSSISTAETDEAGRYRLRVAPGENEVYVAGAGRDHLRPRDREVMVTVASGETVEVPFRVKRGLALTGTAVDEEGKPAAGVALIAGSAECDTCACSMETQSALVSEDGSFSISPLPHGRVTLVAEGEWEVAEPTEVALPVSRPLRVVVRKTRLFALTGRVVTPDGIPVAGATVRVSVFEPSGPDPHTGRMGQREVTTDAEGRYLLDRLTRRASVHDLSAAREGHCFVSGGEVTKREDGFEASDLVLVPLTGSVAGRVVDADGRPIVRATVLVPEASAHTATTVMKGRFALSGVPAGEVTVVAVRDRLAGQARVAAGTEVEVVVRPVTAPPGNDIEWGAAVLEEARRDSEGTDYYARGSLGAMLAPYDPDRALALAERAGCEFAVSGVIYMLLEANPARAAEWAPAQLARIDDATHRGLTAAALASRAPLDSETRRRVYEEAKAALTPDGRDPISLMARGVLAGVAYRLGEADAEAMLAQVIADTQAATSEGDRAGLLEAVIGGAAEGGEACAERALALGGLTGRSLASAQGRIVEALWHVDPEAARRRLVQMRPDGDEMHAHHYGVAAKGVIEALGASDPAGVLAIARTVTGPVHRAQALALAAQFQPPAEAAPIFREAQRAAVGESAKMAWVASLARLRDEALGDELFAAARKETGAEFDPEFAFCYAQVDPGAARVRLEIEVAARRAGGGSHPGSYGLTRPLLALTALDVERALELTRALLAGGVRCEVLRKIAQYVLASEVVRRTMPFDRWCATDTWIPGTASGW